MSLKSLVQDNKPKQSSRGSKRSNFGYILKIEVIGSEMHMKCEKNRRIKDDSKGFLVLPTKRMNCHSIRWRNRCVRYLLSISPGGGGNEAVGYKSEEVQDGDRSQ